VAGTVPLAGDLFDVAFRADLRNVALLDRWLEKPGQTRKRSRWLFIAIAMGLLSVLGATILATLWLLSTLLSPGH
jgi:hypothetical protein